MLKHNILTITTILKSLTMNIGLNTSILTLPPSVCATKGTPTTSLTSIYTQRISTTSVPRCNLGQSKPLHMTMKRSNRIFAGLQSKQSREQSSIPRKIKCCHRLVSSGSDSNHHIRLWMCEEEMNLMLLIWSIRMSRLIVLELQQPTYSRDAPRSYWMDMHAKLATLPIFCKLCNNKTLHEVSRPV